MDLRTYLTERNITPSAFAREVGVTPQAMHRYVNGQRWPRGDKARRIEELTGGEVSASDLLPKKTEAV